MRCRSILAAAVITGASGLAAACGSQQAAAPPAVRASVSPCGPGVSSAQAGATLTIDNADNGAVACVRVGAHVMVLLSGTATRTWTSIRSDSGALAPQANGKLTLRMGVTGAYFAAVRRGVVRITSTRPGCRPDSAARCGTSSVFRVTVRVS